MIKLLRASAGSGKTYTLSHTYIDLLLRPDVSDREYRHILAVTFTNKATDEMKSRIIKDLYEISCDRADPRSERAGIVLHNILHDYGAFAISTIDRFFQQTLRSFARELGHPGSYQVELDKKMLAEEAVDNILDSLDADSREDRALIEYIVESMEDRVSDNKSLDVATDLKKMATELKSEGFAIRCAALGLDVRKTYSEQSLRELKKVCRKVVGDFENGFRAKAGAVLEASASVGLSVGDYNRGWFAAFDKYASLPERSRIDDKTVSAAVLKKMEGPVEDWFTKANQSFVGVAGAGVLPAVRAFHEFYTRGIETYFTALKLLGNVYGLVVAARLFDEFDRLQKEKNVICLDESNSLLRAIIDGSDAPFVYEKSGVWIKHFLLDEFQDTSVTQWENFLPLLRESESHPEDVLAKDGSISQCSNLIVGDVKQSIYRWRESDWSLLDSKVQEAFPGHVMDDSLKSNFRSFEEVIKFNNDFYPKAAAMLDTLLEAELPGGEVGRRRIYDIYGDVSQKVGKKEHLGGGYVKAMFCEDGDSQLDAMVEHIAYLVGKCGAGYGDIAVLVRKNDDGTRAASRLIEEGIPVITEDSLCIKNSVTVRRLVSLMSVVDNPGDKVNGRVAMELGIGDIPDSYHSLTGLCAVLYRMLQEDSLCREDCASEVAYVVAFMDHLMDYTRREGNCLRDFLKYWEGVSPTISSSLDGASVRILTIHKSKGLDFPYVIVPFVEHLTLYNSNQTKAWCRPDVDGTPLEKVGDALFHVGLSKRSKDDLFKDSYMDERYNQCVDAINMMYVATTRAARGMLLLSSPSAAKDGPTSFANILSMYCDGQDKEWGGSASASVSASASAPAGETSASAGVYTLNYPVYELADRLNVRPYAAEFFTSRSGALEDLSPRQRGIVLHDILSRVERASDLKAAVDAAVQEGSLEEGDRKGVLSFLDRRIASHPEFFESGSAGSGSADHGSAGSGSADSGPADSGPAGHGARVLRETTLIARDGSVYRPDRILLRPDGSALVVDYKFAAPHESYAAQIEGYASLLREMGYSPVEARLWFVYQNEIV